MRLGLLIATLLVSVTSHASWTQVETVLDSIGPVKQGPMAVPMNCATNPYFLYGGEAMLTGNGDVGLAAFSDNNAISYYISSNEQIGRIAKLFVRRKSGGGNSATHTPFHQQDMAHGEIVINANIGNTRLDTVSYVPHLAQFGQNYVVIELTNKDSAAVTLELKLEGTPYSTANLTSTQVGGKSGNVPYLQVEIDRKANTQEWRAASAVRILSGASNISTGSSGSTAWVNCTVAPNATMQVLVGVAKEAGLETHMPSLTSIKDEAVARANDNVNITTLRATNTAWWQDYWTKSYIVTDQETVLKYYYGGLYVMGCQSRKGGAPTNLSGFWHSAPDGADPLLGQTSSYVLNYNYQSGYFCLPSANRIDQLYSYCEALFQIYGDARDLTNGDAHFAGLCTQRDAIGSTGGNYYDDASMTALADAGRRSSWSNFDQTSTRNYAKLNDQKGLGAFLAPPIINAYLLTEDNALLDYSCPELYKDANTKGVSVYDILRDMADFYADYLTTECKIEKPAADNHSDNDVLWTSGSTGDYAYRLYDSWAREPEHNGAYAEYLPNPLPADLQPYASLPNGPKAGGAKPEVNVPPYVMRKYGDVDSNLDLGLIRFLLRGMIKISQDRNDSTAPIAMWEDILDHLVDYPTTANDGITSNDYLTQQYGVPLIKENKTLGYGAPIRPNPGVLNYRSQGRDSLIGTMGTFIYPGDECREGGPATSIFQSTMKAMQQLHTRTDGYANVNASAPQFIKDIWVVAYDWNNLPMLIPMMVRTFHDPEDVLTVLDYTRANRMHNAQHFTEWNLTQSNGNETWMIIDGLNDMMMMSHLSEKAGAGTLGKSGVGSDDTAQERYIKLFPVWPTNRNASFHQIRARGAFLVSAELNGGDIAGCEIISEKGNICRISNPWDGSDTMVVKTAAGQAVSTTVSGKIYSFNTTPGVTYVLEPSSGAPMVAKLSATPSSGSFPLNVIFDTTGSGGNVTTWELDPGDGSPVYSGNSATAANRIHTYTTDGSFNTTLTLKTAGQPDKSVSKTIVVSPPPSAALLVQYKFNETSGKAVSDATGNGYNGTTTASGFTGGKYGNAFRFTGQNIVVPKSAFDQVGDQFTVMMWMKDTDSSANDQVPFHCTDAGGSHLYQIGLWGNMYVKFAGQEISPCGESTFLNGGSWAHWAFVCDAAGGSITVYKNGSILKQESKSMTLTKPAGVALGSRVAGNSKFTGYMDDFRLYKSALTATEIADAM